MNSKDIPLGKTISWLLRHDQSRTLLNEQGEADVDALIAKLHETKKYKNVTVEDVKRIVATDDKQRYRLTGNKIKALFGHSIDTPAPELPTATPPKKLYHGTSKEAAEKIKTEGLRSLTRKYVHLANTIEQAYKTGERKTEKPVILEITTKTLTDHTFYTPDSKTWLTEHVPPTAIRVLPGIKLQPKTVSEEPPEVTR